LKEQIAVKYGIKIEDQVLVKEETNGRGKVLRHDNSEVHRDLIDGSKVYVEPNLGDDKEPLSLEEIERVKNTIELQFSNVDEKEYSNKIIIDKRITLLELKQIIEKAVNLSIDEFKLFRVINESYKSELRNEEEKLTECFMYNNTKLAVERGKPLRQGEIPCKWILYDLEKETKDELFELALPGKFTVAEVKVELIKHWKELQAIEHPKEKKKEIILPDDPSRLRLRNIHGTRLSSIHMNDKLLKEVTGKFYNMTAEVFVQILPEGKTETKVSDDIVVLILRQFHPDKYELGTTWEFDANKDEKLGDFKERISRLTGISPTALALAAADVYDIQKILNVPYLKWHPKAEDDDTPNEKKARYSYPDIPYDTNRLVRSLNLSEGDMLLYRDLTIPTKKLTEEEVKKIKEEEEKKRQAKMRIQFASAGRKEERLDIKIADVSLSDEPRLTIKKV